MHRKLCRLIVAVLIAGLSTSSADAQPAKAKLTDPEVAKDKDAKALLAPLAAAGVAKDGYTWQVQRLAPLYFDKGQFDDFFQKGIERALNREKRGAGRNVKLVVQEREKAAKDKYGRSLHEVFRIMVEFRQTREELFLSNDEIKTLIGEYEKLPRGKRDEVALRRLRQGEWAYKKALPEPKELPKD